MESFKDLKELERICADPVKRKSVIRPSSDDFAACLQQVYASDCGGMDALDTGNDTAHHVQPFSLLELQTALKKLSKRKSADRRGIVLEMFADGGQCIHEYLLIIFNRVLATGQFPSDWSDMLFIMLPKTGDPLQPSNWRPIAILDAAYKIFAKMIYHRLQPTLEGKQSPEQMGFRPERGSDDALLVAECILGQAIEWNAPVWIISIDLQKAFDRIEYKALFSALAEQGVDDSYLSLLQRLYSNQSGNVANEVKFPVTRGVRQNDVLSPLIFNVALENVISKWKMCLHDHGIKLNDTHRLTNLRYANVFFFSANRSLKFWKW